MEEKFNEATPQRPEGDRMLNASLVTMDLNQFIAQVRNESSWKDSDRNSITIFKSDVLRVVLIGLHAGAEIKTHTTEGFISVQVLEGHIRFIVEGGAEELQKGQMLALHPQIAHSVAAIKESFFLLTLAMVETPTYEGSIF